LIRIDIESEQLCRNIRPSLPIVRDSALTIKSITNSVEDKLNKNEAKRVSILHRKMKEDIFYNNDVNKFFDTIRKSLPSVVVAGSSTLST